MKKAGLLLLCLVVFALSVGGAAAYLLLTPRGLLRSDSPEELMQGAVNTMDRSQWRAEYVRLNDLVTSPFEDADTVAGHMFDAAVPGEEFTFRPTGESTDREQSYIVSGGGRDILLSHLTFSGRRWSMEFRGLNLFRGETHSITVTVPEGTALTLNGRPVGGEYVVEERVEYGDMTELERRFENAPHLVRYRVEGLYENVELEAQREGGLTLLYADGQRWEYTAPDARSYSFCVTAPEAAVVTVNGAALTPAEITGRYTLSGGLNIPEELMGALPVTVVYTAGGLYSQPQISAAMPDGTPLLQETDQEGRITYSLPFSQELYDACHQRVESFLTDLCEYGSGHTARYDPSPYAVYNSPVYHYVNRARASLYWVVNVATAYQEVSSREYVPLGDNAFLCVGHVNLTTTTQYQTKDLELEYDMLWVRRGGAWMIQDMAYRYTKAQ